LKFLTDHAHPAYEALFNVLTFRVFLHLRAENEDSVAVNSVAGRPAGSYWHIRDVRHCLRMAAVFKFDEMLTDNNDFYEFKKKNTSQ
jgi:hypothetical protein